MSNGWHTYTSSVENQTMLTDGSDFCALIGGANPYRILEVSVFQRGTTTLTMDVLIFKRGVAAAGGTAETVRKYTTTSPTATCVLNRIPTTDVGTLDWEYKRGFNLLQEEYLLPIPKLQLPCKANDDFGIIQATTTAHTGVGVTIVWEEYTGS